MIPELIALTTFRQEHALVLRDKVTFTYEKYGDFFLIGSDESGTFFNCLYHKRPTKDFQAFGGHAFDIQLKNGEIIHCNGQWWDGGSENVEKILGIDLVSVAYSDVESLQDCYVYSGAMGAKDKIDALIGQYTGKVYGYNEFERAYWNREHVTEQHDGFTRSYSKRVKNPDFVNEASADTHHNDDPASIF